MAFKKLFNRKDNALPDNIGQVADETATQLIKQLAGGDLKQDIKLIDNIVVVTNAAGGTGASTVVSNVAHIAAKNDMRVLVIDLNILSPVQHSYFDIKQTIEKPDLISFIRGHNTVGESIDIKGNISVLFANNRGLMEYIGAESDLEINNFNDGINKLRQLYDLILIDTPMRIEHTLINNVFYNCDQIYLVWDEGISSIANTERIRRNMALTGIDVYTKMKVILNKRTSIHYSEYPFEKLNIELVGVIPFDVDVIDTSLRSQIFCDKGESKSYTAKIIYNEYHKITNNILENGGYIK